MNRLLVKYSGKTVYIIKEEDIEFQALKKDLEKDGFQVVVVDRPKEFLKAIEQEAREEKEENGLVLIPENLPSRNLIEHFNYLNLTVKWILSILNKFRIGFLVFNKEHYLAYNNVFQQIMSLSHEQIKTARIDTYVNSIARKPFLQNIKRCLDKEIRSFSSELEMTQKKKDERCFIFFGFSLTIESNSLGTGFVLNEKDHNLDDPEAMRANKLIISELSQAFKIASKIHSVDITKVKSESKQKIINELAEEQPDYGRLNLSDREYEVLNLIYKGYTNQQIANELYISKRTVDFHRSNLLGKTNSRNTADLIRFALQNHLIIE
jgi:DNA-binding CsgD family transcriptional regulator